jgi:hypothetical protein
MKQTAVEWLRDLYENQPAYDEFILDEQWQKAIEVEKEQMIDFAFNFYYDFCNKTGVPFNLISENRINAEQYFDETFNTKEPEFKQINQDNLVTKGSTALVRTFNTKKK